MEIEVQKEKSDTNTLCYGLPISGQLKEEIDRLKRDHRIAVNSMMRRFLKDLVFSVTGKALE